MLIIVYTEDFTAQQKSLFSRLGMKKKKYNLWTKKMSRSLEVDQPCVFFGNKNPQSGHILGASRLKHLPCIKLVWQKIAVYTVMDGQ